MVDISIYTIYYLQWRCYHLFIDVSSQLDLSKCLLYDAFKTNHSSQRLILYNIFNFCMYLYSLKYTQHSFKQETWISIEIIMSAVCIFKFQVTKIHEILVASQDKFRWKTSISYSLFFQTGGIFSGSQLHLNQTNLWGQNSRWPLCQNRVCLDSQQVYWQMLYALAFYT